MNPLQVWLPWLGYGVGFPEVSRDVRRAQSAWDGHDVIYLLPDLRAPARWTLNVEERAIRSGAIPAEHLDGVTIFHVGANGYVFAPYHPRVLHGHIISDLLTRWLNIDVAAVRIAVLVPIELTVPDVVDGNLCWKDGRLRYEILPIRVSPGPAFPMEVLSESDSSRTVGFRWPPEDHGPQTMHPDAESAAATAPRVAADLDGVPGALDPETGQWHPHILFLWPPPFDQLLGPLAGFDVLQALAAMRSIAADGNPTAALARARALAADYLSAGHSTLGHTTFWPTVVQVERPDESIRAFWETLGIKAGSIEEATADEKLSRQVPVVRAWGGLGLLWALLIERLESATPIRSCTRCGRFLGGRRKVCGKYDDPDCYQARRSADQRRSRG